jgi:hypothetical protein
VAVLVREQSYGCALLFGEQVAASLLDALDCMLYVSSCMHVLLNSNLGISPNLAHFVD